MSDAETTARVGTTLLGKWTLESLLGTGGMAAVYVGVHKIGRRDAIKILHPEVAASAEYRARFEREAHAVNRFKHPGAVEIRDIDVTEDGAPFLVMELLEGETVADRSKRGDLTHEDALRFADELLDVLAAAHAEGIIHRDIKPDNLFIQTNGSLKVLDFGIARVQDAKLGGHKTRTGQTIGTVSYMPAEQVKGNPIDLRADIYATGATMFRVLAKRRVHEGKGELELLMQVANVPAPPLASVVPDASPGLCLVVDRALAYDRNRRYPDARSMQTDVRAVRRGEPPPYATALAAQGDSPHEIPPKSLAPPPDAEPSGGIMDIPPISMPRTVREAPPQRPPPRAPLVAPPIAPEISDLEEPPISLLGNAAMSVRSPDSMSGEKPSRALGIGVVVVGLALIAAGAWFLTRSRTAPVENNDIPVPEATKGHTPPSKSAATATATVTTTAPPAASAAPPPTLPPVRRK